MLKFSFYRFLIIIFFTFFIEAVEAQPLIEWSPHAFDLRLQLESELDTLLVISNVGSDSLTFSISITFGDQNMWLSASPDSGEIAAAELRNVQLYFATSELGVGIYYATIEIATNDPEHLQVNIPVVLRIIDHLGCQLVLPNGGTVTATVQQEADTTISFFILNIGDSACSYRAIPMDPWLSVLLESGEIPANASESVSVTISAADLDEGEQIGYVQFLDQADNLSLLTVQVAVEAACLRPQVAAEQSEDEINFTIDFRESSVMPVLVRVWQRFANSDWEWRYSLPVDDSLEVSLTLLPEQENWFRFQTVCQAGQSSSFLELGPFFCIVDVDQSVASPTVPSTSSLLPGFPNPFNSHIMIRYQLAKDSNVTLSIYDAAGNRIKSWSNKEKNSILGTAGVHSLLWDGKNDKSKAVSSGVYWLILSSEQHRWRQSIVLVR